MKTSLLTLLAGLLIVNPAPAAPTSDPVPVAVDAEKMTIYQIDPAHTTGA